MSEQFSLLYQAALAAPYVAGSGEMTVTAPVRGTAPTEGTFSLSIADAATGNIIVVFRVASVSGTTFSGTAEGPDASAASASPVYGTMLTPEAMDQIEADTEAAAVATAVPEAVAATVTLINGGGVLELSAIPEIPLATGVSGVLPRANGGLDSSSPGTGLLRDGVTPAASELSGDVTTSGSNAATVVKVNGAAVPSDASLIGSNSGGQLVAAVNPALGTPASGDLANCTGYPLDEVTGVLPRANGGLDSSSPGTGLLRDGVTPAASELSGDAATSGSNAVTVTGINGAAVPAGAPLVGTNSSGQVTSAIGGATDLTDQDGNISDTNVVAVAVSGMYLLVITIQVTTAASLTWTLPGVNVEYIQEDSAATVSFTAISSTAGNPGLGAVQTAAIPMSAQVRTPIIFNTAGYASSGAVDMLYSIHVRAVFLG